MKACIIAKKVEQKQGFDEKKNRLVLTVLEIKDCFITQIKTPAKEGYFAIQIATISRSPKNVQKTLLGQTKKAGIETPLSLFKEIRIKESDNPQIIEQDKKPGLKINEKVFVLGQRLVPTELFSLGDLVQVTGTGKGKGFQGVVKRHKFAGGPKTHGQSDRERHPGAIGNRTVPGRVFKGKRMAGRMGGETVTIKNLKVVSVDEKHLVLSGLVPGSTKSWLLIKA